MTQNTTSSSEKMTLAEFEQRLQSTDFFDAETGQISDDPRLQAFLTENPTAASLVRDLETLADAVKQLMASESEAEPSDSVWQNIQHGLQHSLDEGVKNTPPEVEGLAAKGTQ